jgi:hypothetical protein
LTLSALFGAWVGCGGGDTVTTNSAGSGSGTGGETGTGGHPTATGSGTGTTSSTGTGGTGGGTTCNPGETDCNGTCAKADDPNFGCGAPSCDPCPTPANATAMCAGGVCVLGGCNAGFKNCDGNDANGCEVNVQTDPTQCGACGSPCVVPNATANCVGGVCGVGTCTGTAVDCDGDALNGCESDTTVDSKNCGMCGNVCMNGETCEMGVCGTYCPKDKANCDNDPLNGCETPLNSATDCAFCGDTCNPANSSSHCDMGTCFLDQCNMGFANCDTSSANGCETNTNTDANNCATCGNVCPSGPNSTAVCNNGGCAIVCDPGYLNCDNNPTNGCEIHSDVDLSNCGTCGKVCTTANGTPGCTGGACTIVTCNSGFKDCDMQVPDGCEVNTLTSTTNCGMCGTICSTPNATPACNNGTCAIGTCNAGFKDCNTMVADGCEINITSNVNNCGACGNVCTVANGTPGCTGSACTVAGCNTGFANCNNQYSDGCEVNTTNNVNNCGICGKICAVANGTPNCVASACGVAGCNVGFKNCNNNPTDGCEVNTQTDPNNCGACGTVCSVANGTAGCSNGMCTVASCNAGYTDCDNNPTNGCEVHTGVDVNNCGVCGKVCSVPNATASCTGGTCTVGLCNAGFTDCDGQPANGCEINTKSDPLHCGLCTTQCFVANGTAGCSNGACTVASCNTNFGNCDNIVANGCETDLRTTIANCGSCGHDCNNSANCSTAGGATMTCTSSNCKVAGCGANRFDIDGACSDGCECASSGTGATCATATSLGTLSVGLGTSYTGNLVPLGQEAYLTVTFSGAANSAYHPHIKMTAGAAEFAFDVFSNCSGGLKACDEGGTSNGRDDWETSWPGTATPPGYTAPIPEVGQVFIHVYRRGPPVSCANYTLTITN